MLDPHDALARTYAQVLDCDPDAFEHSGPTVVATDERTTGFSDRDRWIRHVWCVSLGESVVCSLAPVLGDACREPYTQEAWPSLTSGEAFERVRKPVDEAEVSFEDADWHQREILWYLDDEPPTPPMVEETEILQQGDPGADEHLRPGWEGGVFVFRADDGTIVSNAGIKGSGDAGDILEIAVGTEEGHRQQGYGKAVVARAMAEIRERGAVPTYVPNRLSNEASYALAESLGFEQVGEELFLETDYGPREET
jgi:RimJ/RimL family protein N-acetyltransferase